MLPKENRLTQKQDFDIVRTRGKLIQSNSFAFGYLATSAEIPSRFGFIVSTKISKKATLRNRAKRAIRQGIQQNLNNLKPGIDGVFLAKTSILTKANSEIITEVKAVLRSAGICA